MSWPLPIHVYGNCKLGLKQTLYSHPFESQNCYTSKCHPKPLSTVYAYIMTVCPTNVLTEREHSSV